MIPLNKIIEAALDHGFMCEVACGTEKPSMAMLAKYVAGWPEIAEGHALYLKAKAQHDTIRAERETEVRTVPLASFHMSAPIEAVRGDGGTEV